MTDVLMVDEATDGVVLLALNRPEKRNALNTELRQALIDAFAALAGDDDVRAVVLAGEGQTFCAGFDLDELMSAEEPDDVFAHATSYHHAVFTFAKPIIAAVEGAAVAGGMDLALMCDLRVAATTATFGQPQVKMGVPAAFDLVRTAVSEPAARDLCLTGRRVDCAEAVRMGIVQRSVEPGSARTEAMVWAKEIAAVAGSVSMKGAFLAVQPPLFAPGDPR